MNKLIVILALCLGTTGIAQEKSGRRAMRDLTPEQMATLQTKKMVLALDLTEGQQNKMKAIFLENATVRKVKMEERKAAKEEGESKKPTSEERYAMADARLDAKIAQKGKIKEILSDEQYSKWEKMNHGKRKHRGHKGKGKKGKKGDKKQKE